jgi:mRNA deadenylase 3'-5' endonuclease subunit Ccr4
MTFTVVTYNVLASAYIRPAWYPFTPKELLDPQCRIPTLAEHLAAFKTDIYCLQEVEDESFGAINRRLSPLGQRGELAKKGGGRPDGCALFFRADVFKLLEVQRIEYPEGTDGQANSGHALRKAGFEFTHHAWPRAYTCNSNGKASTIDYLFHNAALRSQPLALPTVEDHTPLPGPGQPSDHVAVMAQFEWAG